jgi:hypothetical protein
MRQFDAIVFMGAGVSSDADCYILHKLLDKALGNLSVLQQGLDDDILEYEIEEAVKDIGTALLGKKIIVGEDLPYPGKIER